MEQVSIIIRFSLLWKKANMTEFEKSKVWLVEIILETKEFDV